MRILTQDLMNQLFEVTDELELDREKITVPLALEGAGAVRRLGDGKLEITLPDSDDLSAFLAALPEKIRSSS